jgi:hypothetical protein
MVGVSLKRWPFARDEEATLHWLRSPQREANYKQWQLTAVFKGQSGTIREMLLPWGTLPLLRLGQVFVDGQLQSDFIRGEVFSIRLPTATEQCIWTAGEVAPCKEYSLKGTANLSENCLMIRSQDLFVVIPVLECIK